MIEDKRPTWDYKTPEDLFRWLQSGVTKIEYKWEMTGVDTSRDWLFLSKDDKTTHKVSTNFLKDHLLFNFDPSYRGLFSLTYQGEQAAKRLIEIKKWEDNHKKELNEYNRLKAKFG